MNRAYKKKKVQKVVLLVFSILVALFLAEFLLRVYKPDSSFGTADKLEWVHKYSDDGIEIFKVDDSLGFRPVLGKFYNKYGALKHEWDLEKNSQRIRLLFIGDSITARGKIIKQLRKVYEDNGYKNFEYWNAGVESYNTFQQVDYYKKYNRFLKPDRVVLTFVLNDFTNTPVVFLNKENKFVVYSPDKKLKPISRFLFTKSYLYRILLRISYMSRMKENISDDIEEKLKELQDILARDNVSFTVLVFPMLKPYEKWQSWEKKAREDILRILNKLEIRHFDLLEPLNIAFKQNIYPLDNKGDYYHPNDEISSIFANYLFDKSLF